MALEERRIQRTKEWLVKAQRDLEAAAILQAQPAPFLDIVAYHCQQTGEKALKAYLFWHDVPFGKTHSLQELLAQCVDVDATLQDLSDAALLLTPLGIQFRYPGAILEPSSVQAEQAIDHARSVFTAVLTRLPSAVAPGP